MIYLSLVDFGEAAKPFSRTLRTSCQSVPRVLHVYAGKLRCGQTKVLSGVQQRLYQQRNHRVVCPYRR